MLPRLCGTTIEAAVGGYHAATSRCRGLLERKAMHNTLNTTRAVNWITLIAMATLVEPLIPRTAIEPTMTEKMMHTPTWAATDVEMSIPNCPKMYTTNVAIKATIAAGYTQ